MKDRLVQTAEQLGWIVTDDFQKRRHLNVNCKNIYKTAE